MIDLSITYGFCRNYGDTIVNVIVSMQLRAKRTSLQLRNPGVTQFADRRLFPFTHRQKP